MRIAMVCAHSSPLANLGGKEAGGMNVYVRELSRELGRRGIFVDIFTRLQDPATPPIQLLDTRVRVVNLVAGPAAPYDKNLLLEYVPVFADAVLRFADADGVSYDLIHAHYFISGEVGLLLREAWGVPLIQMFHTLGAMKNQVARGAEEQETERRVAIEGRLMRKVDALIAATTLDRAQMVWHYGIAAERVDIVPCGVDLRRFAPQDMADARDSLGLPPPPHRVVLLVGRIEPLKGIDALIGAARLLFDRHASWRGNLDVLIVGGGDEAGADCWNAEQRRLDVLRRALDVADAVHFVGARPQEQLAAYYAAADIVTMPSHYESFGMAALEGLASGRPVVATSAGGPAYVVEDGVSGLLTPPDDAAALADRLEALLADDALRQRIGLAARERALRFGWGTVACDILQIYRQLLYQRSGQRRAG